MKLLPSNNLAGALLVLSQSQQISARIITEVTDHGITLLKGSDIELDAVKQSINEIMDDASRNREKRGLMSNSVNIKELIMQQIAAQLDQRFAVAFDFEAGEEPQRGAYHYAEMESQLYSTGLKKDADDYGVLPLPKSHYCRYRKPTEVDGDNDNCCEGENKQCYTEAGCFCDESCYTKYGDCCTDHFVKCYQKLKLCLISIDDEKSEKEDKEGNGKKNFITEKNSNEYARVFSDEEKFQARMTQRSMFLTKPDHITPNECCGQKPYNSADERVDQRTGFSTYPMCCSGELEWATAGALCSKR